MHADRSASEEFEAPKEAEKARQAVSDAERRRAEALKENLRRRKLRGDNQIPNDDGL